MKRQDIINELALKPFIKQLTELEDTQLSSQGVKLYAQHYIEVDGNVARETKAHIYVIKEGLPEEEAFYKDREPETGVTPIHPLVKKYQATINSVHGKVIDKGEGFIVVSGYEVDGTGGMLPKTWFAEEVNGELAVKEIK